jgi:predicted methyltransferase
MRPVSSVGIRGLSVLFVLAGCGGPASPASDPAGAGATSAQGATGAATASAAATAPSAAATGNPAGAGGSTTATAVEASPQHRAIVAAPDRDAADKALDAGRHPAEILTFFGVTPGMKVAEIGAAGGYTTELLARAVAPGGVVYGVNSPWILEKFAQKPWAARLAKPVNKDVVKVTRELDDPLPPEAKDLDAVFSVLLYHDMYWLKGSGPGGTVDRAKMNAAVFKALKPGGIYAVIDHSAKPGAGATEVKTTHRIEEKTVREEIEKAGFKLAAEASFLRNPQDARDWNTAPFAAKEKRGTSDRFVLKFVKP